MHLKPHAVKGQYVKSIAVSATMSPGVHVAAIGCTASQPRWHVAN